MISHLPIIKLGLVITALLAIAVLSAGQDAGVPTAKQPYVRTGYEAALSGTITFTGMRPKTLRIDMSSDAACYALNPEPTTEYAVGDKRHLANVIVYLKSEALNSYKFEPSGSPAMLEHRGCRYVPHVLGIQVGQPLNIFNRDSTIHNTHAVSRKNSDWNQTQPAGTPPLKHAFEQPDMIAFRDNQHPWEKAYVGVFDHPFFAVSDELGNYRIDGLPPGPYTVVAWHERFGEQTEEITVVSGEARNLDFVFDAK